MLADMGREATAVAELRGGRLPGQLPELAAQAPVGFCDPAGFTVDGFYENFDSRGQTEQTS